MRGSLVASCALACACGRIGFDPLEGEALAECGGFENATLASTMLANDRVVLAAGATTGTVGATCDAGETVTWQALTPLTAAPYDKPIVTMSESGYADTMLDATGLIAYWSFDASGSVADNAPVAGFGGSVLAINPDNMGLVFEPCRFGNCLHFDGIDAYLKGTIPAIDPDDYTLAAWVNLDELATENHILAPSNVQFFVENNARLECGDANGEYDINGSTPIVASRWHHTALVQTPNGWTMYLDGVMDIAGTQVAMTGTNLLIGEIVGEFTPAAYAMNGRIEEAVIFSRALSPQEVRELFERAALRVRYEVRTCNVTPCTGAFAGPFSEATNTSATPASFDLSALPPGRYLEWRATLETDAPGSSPQLVDIDVR